MIGNFTTSILKQLYDFRRDGGRFTEAEVNKETVRSLFAENGLGNLFPESFRALETYRFYGLLLRVNSKVPDGQIRPVYENGFEPGTGWSVKTLLSKNSKSPRP